MSTPQPSCGGLGTQPCWPCQPFFGVPSVYHIHMGRLPQVVQRKSWEWWGMRWALNLANRVVVLTIASEQALRGLLRVGRVVRLPNAVPPLPYAAAASGSTASTVLYLGHIIPSKGVRELMEAWRDLSPQGWRLRLAGRGSPDYQRELASVVGSKADVRFLGDLPQEQAWAEMLAADVFVLPTHTEGFPNVILEAMVAGKAIVSTRVGAVAEMLDADEDEPCGLVIDSQDAEALRDALHGLMSNPRLRQELGQRARAKVTRSYTPEAVFPRLLGLWREVAGRPADGGGKSSFSAGSLDREARS